MTPPSTDGPSEGRSSYCGQSLRSGRTGFGSGVRIPFGKGRQEADTPNPPVSSERPFGAVRRSGGMVNRYACGVLLILDFVVPESSFIAGRPSIRGAVGVRGGVVNR